MSPSSLLPEEHPIRRLDVDTAPQESEVIATDDHRVIREWAQHRRAEPSTGEETRSGPATVDVRDGDAGIRFNFPAAAAFRPISWDEWFQNFDRHELLFVYEREGAGEPLSSRYRLVPKDTIP